MSVYVDSPLYRYGRMVMCHMMADTTEELLEMADAIGVQRKWLQKAGQPDEHFDIAKVKRHLAVRFGAKPVTGRELAMIVRSKRQPSGGSTCRCGSGAMPRRCAVHPERYAEHCREISEESGGSDERKP